MFDTITKRRTIVNQKRRKRAHRKLRDLIFKLGTDGEIGEREDSLTEAETLLLLHRIDKVFSKGETS